MDIPVVTDEQHERFKAEWNILYGRMHQASRNIVTRIDGEQVWVLARAYSEMQVQNLLGAEVTI